MADTRSKLWFVTFLTLVRFPLVLLFVAGAVAYSELPRAGWLFALTFAALVTSAVTDLLDGHFARKLGVETRFGAHADPLMDKLFYLATLPLLVYIATRNGHFRHGLFLLGITVFFLARDQWVSFLRSIGSLYNADGSATWSGKLRTCINFPLICCIYYFEEAPVPLFGAGLLHAFEAVACLMNVVSLYSYTRSYWPYLHHSTLVRMGQEAECAQASRAADGAKRESLITMATGVAHDFNNLLAAVLGNTTIVLRGLPPDSPVKASAQQAGAITEQAIELTQRIQTSTGRGRMSPRRLDISALSREVAEAARAGVPAEVAIELRLAGSLPPVCGDPAELKQALANVLANAFDSIIEGPGRIAIATGVHGHGTDEPDAMWFDSPPPAERQCVFAEVSDTGCGMPPAVVRKMFDPFFTTKIRAQGLGLSVALGIVRGHSGAFRVRSEPSRGTVVRMVLPVSGS